MGVLGMTCVGLHQCVKRHGMVELTDKEVLQILDDNLEGGSLVDICRAVETAVIRKNT